MNLFEFFYVHMNYFLFIWTIFCSLELFFFIKTIFFIYLKYFVFFIWTISNLIFAMSKNTFGWEQRTSQGNINLKIFFSFSIFLTFLIKKVLFSNFVLFWTNNYQLTVREEIDVIRHTSYYRAFNFSFFFTASRFILLSTFLVFGFTGQVYSSFIHITWSLYINRWKGVEFLPQTLIFKSLYFCNSMSLSLDISNF